MLKNFCPNPVAIRWDWVFTTHLHCGVLRSVLAFLIVILSVGFINLLAFLNSNFICLNYLFYAFKSDLFINLLLIFQFLTIYTPSLVKFYLGFVVIRQYCEFLCESDEEAADELLQTFELHSLQHFNFDEDILKY